MIDNIETMPHGKHSGIHLDLIPAEYLQWYSQNVCPTYMNQHVHDYIQKNYGGFKKQEIQIPVNKEHI